MANRYWVGGAATWDATAGTKWALTSGAAGGQAVPTSSDDVFFDAASGTVAVLVSGSRVCNHLNLTGFTGSFTSSGPITAAGNVTLAATVTSFAPGLTMNGAGSLNTNGLTIGGNFSSSSTGANTITLASNLTIGGTFTHGSGVFNASTFDVTIGGSLSCTGSTARTLNMGSGVWTFNTSALSQSWSIGGTNLTFTKGSAIINFALTGHGQTFTFTGNSFTYNGLRFSGAVRGWNITFAGANTFTNLDLSPATAAGTIHFPNGTTTVISSVTRGLVPIRWQHNSTSQATLSCSSGVVNLGNGHVQNIIGTGGATFIASGAKDTGNNTNVNFKLLRPRVSTNVGMG